MNENDAQSKVSFPNMTLSGAEIILKVGSNVSRNRT